MINILLLVAIAVLAARLSFLTLLFRPCPRFRFLVHDWSVSYGARTPVFAHIGQWVTGLGFLALYTLVSELRGWGSWLCTHWSVGYGAGVPGFVYIGQ